MRLGLLVAMLALVCGTTTACATGLSGAAVGTPPPPAKPATTTPTGPPQFGGPLNLLSNGTFTAGTDPWMPSGADLQVASTPHPTALLVRPATPGSYFATRAVVMWTPSKGQRYSLGLWVRGSRDLVGSRVQIGLGAVKRTGPKQGVWVNVAEKHPVLASHWRHFFIRGKVPIAGALNVTAVVGAQARSKYSWLALDGVAAKLVQPVAKPARSRSPKVGHPG
jgi:hypothetical protein